MKKLFLYMILIGIIGVLFYSYFMFYKHKTDINALDKLAYKNFQSVADYLKKNYKGHYPIPKGDLILLDKHNSLIHLTDRKTPLNKIKNLTVIQGTTCDILKNDKKFQKINYDPRFSIFSKDKKKILYKRCFVYSVTKDQKDFQIATILYDKNETYTSKLLGTSSKPMIKSYDSVLLVKDNSDNLPYPAGKLSPIVILKNKHNSSIKVKVDPFDEKSYSINIKEGANAILSGNSSSYDIEIVGDLLDDSILQFVDTNGSIVYISPQKNSHKVDFKIKNYSINTKKIDYFVETGRFLASIVKLGDDKDMKVSKGDVTLVIRGTKFTIDAGKDSFNTFLSLGHIIEKIKGQTVNLTLQNAFSLIKNNEIVKDIEKIKELASFTVYNDIKINPNYKANINIYGLNILPEDLTGVYNKFKGYKLSYKNGQEIGLIIFSDPSHFLDYIKKNKKFLNIKGPIKRDIDYYKDIVNDVCKSNKHGKGLDLSKLYYVLNNTSNTLNGFSLKDNIKSSLGLNEDDYILFTSRKYNGQYSNRLAYNSKTHTIDSYNFARLSTDHDIKKIIFACDIK